MNFEIPAAFAYADTIWAVGALLVSFAGGWIAGGICQR